MSHEALRAELRAEHQKRLFAYGLLVSASILCLGLAGAVVYLVILVRGGRAPSIEAVTGGDARERAVAQLVDLSGGVWDSHPDPDVGRLLQPNLVGRKAHGSWVSSNPFGWRERAVVVPKPAGTARVVLLGDSFVFGPGVGAEDRAGVFLEKMLAERAGVRPKSIEVLHLGMGSWNTRAEVAYMRRNLTNLAPDLVVQIAVSNDLEDSGSVRGFGVVADFTSQRPYQTMTMFDAYPTWGLGLGFKKVSHLNKGLSWEGRRRYEEDSAWLLQLSQATAAAGVDYLFVLDWADQPKTAAHYLARPLPPEKVSYLPASFRADARFRISPSDPHWSRGGGEQVAKYLYGAMRERGLLKDLQLAEWKEAEDIFRAYQAEGAKEAALDVPLDLAVWSKEVAGTVDFKGLTEPTGAQIYGGVDKDGNVGPYASVVLARGEATRVHIKGRALEAVELTGTKVSVFLDDEPAATLDLTPSKDIDLELELPAEVKARPFFDVRFTSPDWVYRGQHLRQCVVFRLEKLEVLGATAGAPSKN